MYTQYCNNYELANDLVKQYVNKKQFETFIDREKKNSGGLDLDSLLITPVQRYVVVFDGVNLLPGFHAINCC